MRLISWLITVPLGVIAVMFALSNNVPVTLTAWPTPFEIDLPIYLLVFVPFLLGFIIGGFFAWWGAGAARGRAREAERDAERKNREADNLRTELELVKQEAAEQSAENLPAINQSSDPNTKSLAKTA